MKSHAKEKRTEARIRTRQTIFIEEHPDGRVEARVIVCPSVDVSQRGLKVVLDVAPPLESIQRLCLDMKDKDPIVVIGEVKWSLPIADSNQVGFLIVESTGTDLERWQETVSELAEAG